VYALLCWLAHLDVHQSRGGLLSVEERTVDPLGRGCVPAKLLQLGICIVQGGAGGQGLERSPVHPGRCGGGGVLRGPGGILEPGGGVVVQVHQALQGDQEHQKAGWGVANTEVVKSRKSECSRWPNGYMSPLSTAAKMADGQASQDQELLKAPVPGKRTAPVATVTACWLS
jgi:hypothetical protein